MPLLHIGISSCLAGNRVRYDGGHKYWPSLIEFQSETVKLLPICPEVAIGLGTPRPAIHLTGSCENPQALQIDRPEINVTARLRRFAWQVADTCSLDGYIFKSRSPSCGLESTPVYVDNQPLTTRVSGIFAQSLLTALPGLPVIDQAHMESESEIRQFIDQCRAYQARRHAFRSFD